MVSAWILAGVLSLSAAQAPAPAPSSASQRETVERLYAEGVAFFRAQRYREAIEKFQEAYALYPEPNLLFNMGRAYEALGEHKEAISAYRGCASAPGVAPEVAARAKTKADTLERVMEQIANAPTPAPSLEAQPPAAAPPATTSVAPATTAPAPPAAEGGFPVLGTAGGALAVLGVGAAVGGGVVFGLGAMAHGQIENAKSDLDSNGVAGMTRVEAERLASEGSLQKTVGITLLSVGAGVALLAVPLVVGELVLE